MYRQHKQSRAQPAEVHYKIEQKKRNIFDYCSQHNCVYKGSDDRRLERNDYSSGNGML